MFDHKKQHQKLKKLFSYHHKKIGKNLKKIYIHFHGLKQSSGFSIRLFDSISKIPANDWNAINSENILLSLDYLKAVEKSSPNGMTFKYTIFYQDKKPVTNTYFQLIQINRKLHKKITLNSGSNDSNIIQRLHDHFSKNLKFNLLICGNILLSGENGFSYLPEIDESKVYHGIIESIKMIKEELKGKIKIDIILIKDFLLKSEVNTTIFPGFQYQGFSIGPNMIIPIKKEWKTFDDYTKSMKSKYRQRVTSCIKKGDELIRKSLNYQEIMNNETKKEIYKLYLEVVNQAKFKLFVLDINFFATLKKNLNENFMLDVYYAENKVVAFTTRIFNGNIMEGYTHGINALFNKKYELYQNILYDDIRVAIERKCSQINLGRTSVAMKSSVGAIPDEMNFFISLNNPVSNSILRVIYHFYKPSRESYRNPFHENNNG